MVNITMAIIGLCFDIPITYDHRVWRTGLPVRSAVLKPIIVCGQFSMRPEL
jgi:hypothetical protein